MRPRLSLLALLLVVALIWWVAADSDVARNDPQRERAPGVAEVPGDQPSFPQGTVVASGTGGASGSDAAAARAGAGAGDGSPAQLRRPEGAAALPTLAELRERIDRPALVALERRLAAAVAAAPDDGELRVDLCEAARLLGHHELAVEQGRRAIALLPDDGRAHHQYAKALGEQMRAGGLFTAIRLVGTYKEQMEQAIALDPSNARARSEQIAFLLFMPAMAGGDAQRGLALARELEQDDARWGLIMQALAAEDADDEPGAIALCERALERFPGDQRLTVTLAGLLKDAGRIDEADARYEQVLSGLRGEAWYLALYGRARMHIRTGERLQQAVDALREYLAAEPYGELLPPPAKVCYRLGTTLQQLGELDAAAAAWRQALQFDPDYERAEEALQALEQR